MAWVGWADLRHYVKIWTTEKRFGLNAILAESHVKTGARISKKLFLQYNNHRHQPMTHIWPDDDLTAYTFPKAALPRPRILIQIISGPCNSSLHGGGILHNSNKFQIIHKYSCIVYLGVPFGGCRSFKIWRPIPFHGLSSFSALNLL